MIGRAIHHHDLEEVLSNGSSCVLLKRRLLKKKKKIESLKEPKKRVLRKRSLRRLNAPSPIFVF